MTLHVAFHGRLGRDFRALRLLKSERGESTYVGEDCTSGAQVVIKTTAAVRFTDAERLRCEHEIGALHGVDATLLTAPSSVGINGDDAYCVRAYVEGITLQECISDGPMSPREVVDIGREIVAGLAQAHDRGVLHGDVKPANVIIDAAMSPGGVTLVDVGFAASVRLEADANELPVTAAHYVSPEQAGLLHRDVGACSDLYSTGVVLFECLAGRAPFLGDSVGEVLRGHASSRPPRLRALGARCPRRSRSSSSACCARTPTTATSPPRRCGPTCPRSATRWIAARRTRRSCSASTSAAGAA